MKIVKVVSMFLIGSALLVGCQQESATPPAGTESVPAETSVPKPLGEATETPVVDDAASHTTAKATEPIKDIKKAEGGLTIQEVYAKKTELSGKEVKVRGKVVKYMAGIMGANFLHVQDGTGSEGTNDLTVTTQGNTEIGKVITISGKLTLDKDLGSGYKYAVIVENATITE